MGLGLTSFQQPYSYLALPDTLSGLLRDSPCVLRTGTNLNYFGLTRPGLGNVETSISRYQCGRVTQCATGTVKSSFDIVLEKLLNIYVTIYKHICLLRTCRCNICQTIAITPSYTPIVKSFILPIDGIVVFMSFL